MAASLESREAEWLRVVHLAAILLDDNGFSSL
jgi:hypothetical protein